MTGQEAEDGMHIFFVQSYISFFVCNAIIREKQLRHEDVLFLFDRQTGFETDFPSLPFPDDIRAGPRNSFRGIAQNRRLKRRTLDFFRDISKGRPFQIYLNRTAYPFAHLLRSYGKCLSINLYEEGLAAYYRELGSKRLEWMSPVSFREKFRKKILEWLSGYGGLSSRAFYDIDYGMAYCIQERAFPDFPRRQVLDIAPVLAQYRPDEMFEDIPHGSCIFVLPHRQDYRNLESGRRKRLVSVLSEVVRAVLPDHEVLFQKHPEKKESPAFWNEVLWEVTENTGCDISTKLIENRPLEVLAYRRSDLSFVVVASSAGLYADLFGRNVLDLCDGTLGPDHPKARIFGMVCPEVLRCGERLRVPPKFLERL